MNKMIKHYNEFLNEKLTDNLKGFDESGIKQQFLNGDISYYKYLELCKQNNFELPSTDEMYNTLYDKHVLIYTEFNKDEFLKEICKLNIANLLEKALDETKYSNIKLNVMLEYITDLDCIKILIKYGADIYYDTDGESVLKISIRRNSYDIFKYYIDDCNFEISVDSLEIICDYNRNAMIEYMFKHKKISMFKQSRILIHIISYNHNLDMLKTLLEKCNIDVNINKGKSLIYAIKFSNIEIVKYLLEHGADIDYISFDDISECITNGNYEILKLIINNGYVLYKNDLFELSKENHISVDDLKKLIYD